MAINKKLINFATRANFDEQFANNQIDSKSIVFINDTQEMWTHGVFFSGKYSSSDTQKVTLKIGNVSKDLSLNGHTHSYLPLTGGEIITGALKVSSQFIFESNLGSSYREGIRLNLSGADASWAGLAIGGARGTISGITGAWWVARNTTSDFVISYQTSDKSGGLFLPSSGTALSFKNNTIYHSGNIPTWNQSTTGNAATVTKATFYRQFTVRDDRSDSGNYSLAARPTGLYAISGNGTNGPSTAGYTASYLSLIHVANHSDVAFQIAGGYTSDNMYFRGTSNLANGTGYTAWRKVLHDGNYSSFNPSINGSHATSSTSIYAPTSQLSVQSATNSYLVGATSTTSLNRVYSNASVYMNGGSLHATSFVKSGSSSSYVLTGDGGHKSISDFNASLVTSTTTSGITNITTSNTNTYLNIVQGGASVGSSTQIVGSNGVTVASDATGKLTITGLGAHAGIYSSRANGSGASSNSIEAKDTRSINPLPDTDLQRGVWFDFKTNSAIGLTGASTYSSVITMVPYGDNSGNYNTSFRLAQSGNNLYFQNWTTVWGTWNKLWHSGNLANGTTAQYIRGDGSLATYSDTTYTIGTLVQLNAGTDTTGRLQTAKLLNDWLNPKLALKATPADISTAINGIEIGGRNLAPGTGNPYLSTAGWLTDGWIRSITPDITNNGFILTATNGWGSYYISRPDLAGVQVTITAKALRLSGLISLAVGTGANILTGLTVTTADVLTKIAYTFTVHSSGRIGFSIREADNSGQTTSWFLKEVNIEIGNKATDWSPAPEDVDASIATKLSLSGGTMTGAITSSIINSFTTPAESWIGPSSTTGVYFKGGNVGIGTATPTEKLELYGNLLIKENSLKVATNDYWGGWARNLLQLQTGGQTTSGSPATLFSIGGLGSSGTNITYGYAGSSYDNTLQRWYPSTKYVTFDGNVGIGTTAPLSKLSINGGLHVGGDSDAGDNNILADGTITGSSFSGAGTGLTGTASSLSIGGNAATATTASKVANSLSLKFDTGTTEGTSLYTFNGSSAKTIDIKAGSNVSISKAAGIITISSTDTNIVYTHPTTSGNKHIPTGGLAGQILRWNSDGTAGWGADNNNTYTAATTTNLGLVKLFNDNVQSIAGNTVTATASRTYGVQVNSSGQLVVNVPWTDNNTTYGIFNTTTNGLVPKTTTSNTTDYLRRDGTWATPPNTDTHYTTGILAGASGTNTAAAVTNPYVKVLDNTTYRSQIRLLGSGGTTISSDSSGNITIKSTSYSNFVGATASVAGTAGLVPAPTIANYTNNCYLKSNGTWTQVNYSHLTGTIPNAPSATYASAVTLTADNSTNATNYPLFVNAATGNLSPRTDTGFTYNPSTGSLNANSLFINTGGYFGNQLEIETPGGTSPFYVNSTTVNTNLNADLLDGKHLGSTGVNYIPYVDSYAKFKLSANDGAYPSEVSFYGTSNDATNWSGMIMWSKIVSRDSQGTSLSEIVCERHTNLANVKGSLAFYTGGRTSNGTGYSPGTSALYLKADNSAQLNNTTINGTLEVKGSLTCTNGSVRNGITNSSTYGNVTTHLLNGGYTKLPSGIIMQYGRYEGVSVTGEGRFRFPMDFPTTTISINITVENISPGTNSGVEITGFDNTYVAIEFTSSLSYKYFHITAFGY